MRGRKPKRAHGGEGEARDARGDVSLMSSSDFLFSKHQAEREEKKRARKELKHARARKDKQEKEAAAKAAGGNNSPSNRFKKPNS